MVKRGDAEDEGKIKVGERRTALGTGVDAGGIEGDKGQAGSSAASRLDDGLDRSRVATVALVGQGHGTEEEHGQGRRDEENIFGGLVHLPWSGAASSWCVVGW